MFDHYYAVIMAGGGGTRLWPLSRQARPKQMLALSNQRSMFQAAIDRLEGLFPPERIYVVTVEAQAALLQKQVPEIPEENYLLEPFPRGTASVVGLAAAALAWRDPQAVMAVLTADHFIENETRFHELLLTAHDVSKTGYLVTLGITPTHPSTGYGYIQMAAQLGSFQGKDVFQVARFKEKPDVETARNFLETGDHAWNSGMFVWSVPQILDEMARQMPELFTGVQQIQAAFGTKKQNEVVEAVWTVLKSETIDYGIMEGAEKVAIIPAHGLGWNDIGSWDSLFNILPADNNGNILHECDHLGVETQGTMVYNDQGDQLIVTIGLQDMIIVNTDDVLMVCHKDHAQGVRAIVKQLKETNRENLL
jgi:mannose-1-phosphate guanylyltransferase